MKSLNGFSIDRHKLEQFCGDLVFDNEAVINQIAFDSFLFLSYSSFVLSFFFFLNTHLYDMHFFLSFLGLLNRFLWMQEFYHLLGEEILLFKTSISFVDHLQEFLGAILSACTLVIPPFNELKQNPFHVIDYLKVNLHIVVYLS